MKKDGDLNIIDKFLYKLLICTVLLLMVVFLGKLEVIDIKQMQADMSEHMNFIPILKAINGDEGVLLPIDLNDQVSVANIRFYQESIKYTNGKRKVILDEFSGVENYKTGIVVTIEQNENKTYRLTIKGIDDYNYIYDELSAINCNIYKVVESGDVIGSPSSSNDENYFVFSVYNKNTLVDVIS